MPLHTEAKRSDPFEGAGVKPTPLVKSPTLHLKRDEILIVPSPFAQKYGRIWVPEEHRVRHPVGTILATGRGAWSRRLKARVPIDPTLKPGTKVVYNLGAAVELRYDFGRGPEVFHRVSPDSIFAIVTGKCVIEGNPKREVKHTTPMQQLINTWGPRMGWGVK